jgi:GH15 family glucan-1,4-alpha-glucosidase
LNWKQRSEILMTDLFQHSIGVILQAQATSGAYLACPDFPSYRFSWFRDSSFIAYAMNLVGEQASATRFHDWAARVINQRSGLIEGAIRKTSRGEPLTGADILHTRYQLDGSDAVEQEWPNFQLDGFGTWLWALGEHIHRNPDQLPEGWRCAADLSAAYLTALWSFPCYDCWEEFPDKVHTHTLAAIYGGLRSHAQITGCDHSTTFLSIRRYILENCVDDGHFIKFPGSTEVDASLLGLSVPYEVVSPQDPLMLRTVLKIEETLQTGGGVHRYPGDTYYGGGEWVLLTAWLGWYYTQLGDPISLVKAHIALEWIQAQAGKGGGPGDLPEQLPVNMNDPSYYQPWVEKWGLIATPLLWSHAKYMILDLALKV